MRSDQYQVKPGTASSTRVQQHRNDEGDRRAHPCSEDGLGRNAPQVGAYPQPEPLPAFGERQAQQKPDQHAQHGQVDEVVGARQQPVLEQQRDVEP